MTKRTEILTDFYKNDCSEDDRLIKDVFVGTKGI